MKTTAQIVLASASPYRKELLMRLRLDFICYNTDVDENPLPDEAAAPLAERLSIKKARAAAQKYPNGLIIAADQTAYCDGNIIGKPQNHEAALRQLKFMAGRTLVLHSGLALHNPGTCELQSAVVDYEITMREFSVAQAEKYLRTEQPYNCCGGLKAEGMGIALIKEMRGTDPTAIIGLPLIKLTDMLSKYGIKVVRE